MNWLLEYWRSSIGGKVTMAVTGLLLFGFLVGHLAGNLQLLAGAEKLNAYAAFLLDLGPLLWIARGGLLVLFVLHVVTGIRLARENRAARPVPYAKESTVQAPWASRSMVFSGLSTLAFVIYHLAHFTFGVVGPMPGEDYVLADGRAVHDVYAMVVAGFEVPWIALAYVAFQAVLFFHLTHGIQSLAQTLGIHHARYTPMIKTASVLLAAAIAGGNIFLVLYVFTGLIGGAV